MKPILIAGSLIVTLALISYSIGFLSEFRSKSLLKTSLFFLALGLALDISGTTCMIIGSSRGAFTFHGIIGYSALLGMLIDNALFWSLWKKVGIGAKMPAKIHIYSLIAYSWWAIVYFSGILMAANR
jgi:uncharacterized repeat protein (TIGR03987 family)